MRMEVDNIEKDPLELTKNASLVKDTQKEIGRMDVLVCGGCHSVFHFIQDLQNHRQECTEQSSIRDGNVNEPKAQVWAFLLWKNTQNKLKPTGKTPSTDKDNSWIMYQKWCKLDIKDRETWVAAGRNVQNFSKISTAKFQPAVQIQKKKFDLEEGEIRLPKTQALQTTGAGPKLTTVRAIVKTNVTKKDDEESDEDLETESELDTEEEAELAEMEREAIKQQKKPPPPPVPQPQPVKVTPPNNVQKPILTDRSNRIAKRSGKAPLDSNGESAEFIVEKILAKRYNPRKKAHEYLLKWEGFPHEQNTWEPSENMATCRYLLEEFERNLAKQKEKKAALAEQEKRLKQTPVITSGRPARNSKIKAMGQVKAWVGSMAEDDTDKRKAEEINDEQPDPKRAKQDDDWTYNGDQKKMLVANAKGVVKVDPNVANLKSGVYIMSKNDGLVKVDESKQNDKPVVTNKKVDNIHMEFHETSDEEDPFPKDLPLPGPESPPGPLTLCPQTGKVLNETIQEPVPTEPEPEVQNEISEEGQSQEEGPLMITGEDGTIYQVAGQDENGQTLLVAQGADGEQQCVYLAPELDEQQLVEQPVTDDLMINTDDSQVVAQVVKAELPSPGGTRKVVLLLPNGTLAITTVDAAQYSALELE